MKKASAAAALSLLLAAGCTWLAWSGEPTDAPPDARELRPPPPTEHWLADDVEKKNVKGRKEWIKGLHKAGPDVDYKSIEESNGFAQMEKRRRLKSGPRGPEDGTWTERGSENQAGRMHAAAWALDGSALYAGSSKGGVWKLEDEAWTPIGDGLYGGAHWLAILSARGDVNRVVAGTDGGYLHYSDDDGETWTSSTGLKNGTWDIRRLAVATDGTETIYVIGGTGWPLKWTLYRSTDGAESFDQLSSLGEYDADVWAPRDGDGRVWLVDSDGLSHSDDHGDSWSSPIPTGLGEDRAELVGSEAGRLWLATDGSKLHASDDEGASWDHVHTMSDYWGELNASITDVDVLAYGGVEFYRTSDGGSFRKMNSWGAYYDRPHDRLHADIMGVDVAMDGGQEVWYINTDGGLYESRDQLDTVDNLSLSGLRVSQYYTTHTSNVSGGIAAGAQDQGYQWSAATTGGSEDFEQLISGDYAHLVSGDGSHEYVYSVYPGIILVQYGEDDPDLSWADFPNRASASWLPPLAADPTDNEAFFFCADTLYRYSLGNNGWDPEEWSDEDFGSGGQNYMSALAFSPLDSDRAWALTDGGKAYWSDDRGVTWTKTDTLNDSQYWYGHALEPSALDVDLVYAGGSGYSGPSIYRTIDGGQNWKKWDEGLPDTHVYDIAEAKDGSGRVFAATETAAYMREADGETWLDITSDVAPITTYWSVEAVEEGNVLRFSTYGRGIWDFVPDPVDVEPTDSDSGVGGDSDAPDRPPEPPGGCGCASSSTRGGAIAAFAFLAFTLRRRRK
ncbi:MAG: hypothetical protein GY913_00710 [Proteobacteria bacterium]|nr:hypothetical protein [Pseudomonadota bacterium]MCP4915418.1 hypothetical protein [Pseudomonadota bacterium]